jgi:hypothetical protein
MKRSHALGAIPMLVAVLSAHAFAESSRSSQSSQSSQPKQAPKKPATKAAPKATPKAPAKDEPPKPAPPPPDLSVTATYAAGDKTTTSTVLMHGQRQRVSYESAFASIQQCDLHRMVQLNNVTRVYYEMPDPVPAPISTTPPATPKATPAGEKHKGGRITYTTSVVDTGETKDTFGFTARHLKTTVVKESSPDACDKRPEKVEIDGWYIDVPDTIACMGQPSADREIRIDQKDATCSDVVTYVRPPASKAYPVSYTMVTTSGTDAPLTTKMEATDIKRTTTGPEPFDIPPDYIPVNSPVQLTMDHRPGEIVPKKPGTIRIGVAPVTNTTGQPVSTADLSQALVESFEETATDVVLLKSETPAEQADEAKKAECDYVLTNTVSEMKRPGRGVLGKIGGANADALSAKIDYTLVAPGAPKPAIAASEHTGTSTLQTAVGAAKRVSQFITPMMMARYGYLKAFSAMRGNAAPALMVQTQDPVLSSIFSFVDKATSNKPPPAITNEDGAAAAALLKEFDAVVAEL